MKGNNAHVSASLASTLLQPLDVFELGCDSMSLRQELAGQTVGRERNADPSKPYLK